MYHTLLVLLDGSEFGEQALPLALSIARRAGATLHLAHVHSPETIFPGVPAAGDELGIDSNIQARERNYLESAARRLRRTTEVEITCALLDGAIADTAQKHAATIGADLIVMTTHGRGPLRRAMLGSVADQMVRQATLPVLLVRPGERVSELTADPPRTHMLIPLDGSPLAEQVLGPAMELGILLQARYTLLQVISPLDSFLAGRTGQRLPSQVLTIELAQLREELEAKAAAYLERIAQGMRARLCKVQTRVVSHDQPAVTIPEQAQHVGADLIAIATRGRGGMARFLLGSVADQVLRSASIPLLVYHPGIESENTPYADPIGTTHGAVLSRSS